MRNKKAVADILIVTAGLAGIAGTGYAANNYVKNYIDSRYALAIGAAEKIRQKNDTAVNNPDTSAAPDTVTGGASGEKTSSDTSDTSGNTNSSNSSNSSNTSSDTSEKDKKEKEKKEKEKAEKEKREREEKDKKDPDSRYDKQKEKDLKSPSVSSSDSAGVPSETGTGSDTEHALNPSYGNGNISYDRVYVDQYGNLSYKVIWGDTLSEISDYFNIPMRVLAGLNGIGNYDLIYADSVMLLPADTDYDIPYTPSYDDYDDSWDYEEEIYEEETPSYEEDVPVFEIPGEDIEYEIPENPGAENPPQKDPEKPIDDPCDVEKDPVVTPEEPEIPEEGIPWTEIEDIAEPSEDTCPEEAEDIINEEELYKNPPKFFSPGEPFTEYNGKAF